MKKTIKILVIAILLISICCLTVNASSGVNPQNYTGNTSNYDTGSIGDLGNKIIKIVSTIGSVVSVIILVVLGIKYMMGSAEEKAEYKKTMLPYVIGAALVFAASSIAVVIYNFTSNL
jgi:type IV secretory pathway VirB2 component (pilin)